MARIYYRTYSTEKSFADIVFGPIGPKKTSGFSNNIQTELESIQQFPSKPYELLLALAVSVYAADKGVERNLAQDSWTRNLELNIPTGFDCNNSKEIVEETLRFLSGDRWLVNFREESNYAFIVNSCSTIPTINPDAVCLFSGGIDSFIGAINLLEDGKKVVFVSHYETNYIAHVQQNLIQGLTLFYPQDQFQHIQFVVKAPISLESSSRARSFLFLALACYVAGTFDNFIPVIIPENGFISINPPLTDSRLGSYSTRTTHPYYMKQYQKLLESFDIRNVLENPLQYSSKGEAIERCRNRQVFDSLVSTTLSCSKSGANRWQKKSTLTNCGCCFPCLIRRASLHKVGLDSPNDYVYDAIGASSVIEKKSRGSDIRCLIRGIHRYKNNPSSLSREVLSHGRLYGIVDLDRMNQTVANGFDELYALIRDKGHPYIRMSLGL